MEEVRQGENESTDTRDEEAPGSVLEKHLEREMQSMKVDNRIETIDNNNNNNSNNNENLQAASLKGTKTRLICFMMIDMLVSSFYIRLLSPWGYRNVMVAVIVLLYACISTQVISICSLCTNTQRSALPSFILKRYVYVQRTLICITSTCFILLTVVWLYIVYVIFVAGHASPFTIGPLLIVYTFVGGFFFAQAYIIYQSQSLFRSSLWELNM